MFFNATATTDIYTLSLHAALPIWGSFARLLQQLPLDTEVPALLEDITRLGTANGLVFEEIRLLDEQDRSLYIELPLQIGVIGAYHDLATFISAMAGLSRIVTVHDFTINQIGRASCRERV